MTVALTARAEITAQAAHLSDAALIDAWDDASAQYDTARNRFLYADTQDAADDYAAQQIVRSALFDALDARHPAAFEAWVNGDGADDTLRMHFLAVEIAALVALLDFTD